MNSSITKLNVELIDDSIFYQVHSSTIFHVFVCLARTSAPRADYDKYDSG
ncbi:hypothetical protein KC799_01275 [candidate division KSB1 bacterium]|nr:hypothetical protein [candidate division KSB1 bacterium]